MLNKLKSFHSLLFIALTLTLVIYPSCQTRISQDILHLLMDIFQEDQTRERHMITKLKNFLSV